MVNLGKSSICICLMFCVLVANEIEFDTLEVSANEIKQDEKQFVKVGAVSSKTDIKDSTQSIDSIVRSMPGSYTNTDQTQGSLQVNLRGLTGLGRVNTSIDGVEQTFFGTSADNGKFHTGNGNVGTSAFGAMIDQNFLTSVDVQKGTFNGSGSGIMGSANFKTISVDDVIKKGENVGFLGKYSYGSNGIGPSYMGSIAGKDEFENGGSVGVLFGYSGKKINQDYKVGGGKTIGDQKVENPDFDPLSPQSDSNPRYLNTNPFNPKELTQKPKSYLFKFELNPDIYNKSIFTYRKYDNLLAGRDITQDTYQINHNFNPENDFINLELLAALNKGKQKYLDDAKIFGRGSSILGKNGNLKSENKALTLDVGNTIKIYNDEKIDAHSKFGVNFMDNEYTNSLKKDPSGGMDSIPFQPRGEKKLTTFYLNNTLEYDIFGLDANFNLQRWNIQGHKPKCDSSSFCFPKEASDIDKSGTEFNYSLTASAKLNDLFMPFVTYSKNTRSPNVQEMFFPENSGNSINPFLRPETAKTWQIGFNSYKHGLISDSDVFGLKALYYKTSIKDFIYNKSFYTTDQFTLYLNQEKETDFRGIEIELSYDAGIFFAKSSYSRQKDNQSMNETSGAGAQFFGYSEITQLPKDYATIELGTRLFAEKLTIGTIAKYTGKAKRIRPDDGRVDSDNPNDYFPEFITEELPKIPTIYDAYATYKPKDNLTFKFEVQNVFDKNYMDALNAFNSTGNQYQLNANGNDIFLFNNSSRGRTFVVGFNYKY